MSTQTAELIPAFASQINVGRSNYFPGVVRLGIQRNDSPDDKLPDDVPEWIWHLGPEQAGQLRDDLTAILEEA